MKKTFILLSLFMLLKCSYSKAQIFWTENFESGSTSGELVTAYTGPNGTWTLTTNISTTEGDAPNPWYVSCAENGHTSGICGTGCVGVSSTATLATLHIGANATAGSGLGDMGASYDAGGFCGILYCTTTDRRAESPTINCTGKYSITMSFYYIENGDGTNDDGTVWYYDGTAWSLLVNTPKTSVCTGISLGQGQWANYSIALPSSADNNPNVKIGFRWVNNDDGVGTDPSYAIDSVSLSTVGSSAPTITTPPANTTVCTGGTTNFNVVASGSPTSYQWQRSTTGTGGTFVNITTGMDGGIYGASFSTATLTITAPTLADNGYAYQVIVTNGTGSTTSTPAVLTVNDVPSAGTISGPSSVCLSGTSTLTDGVAGGSWTSSDGTIATIGSSTGYVYGVAAGSVVISYTVTTPCGTATATFNVTVTTSATVDTIAGPANGCVGSSISLTDATAGGTWSSSSTAVATIAGGVVTGIVAGSTVISYSYTGSCGTAIATLNVTIYDVSSAGVITSPDSVCQNSSLILANATGGGFWSASNGNATIASDTLTGVVPGMDTIFYTLSGNGCAADMVITVKPIPQPVIHSLPGHVLAVYGAYTSYQWEKGGVNISGATNSTYTYTSNGNYQVLVDSLGCPDTSVSHNFGLGVDELANPINGFSISQSGAIATLYASMQLTENLDVNVFDMTGRLISHEVWMSGTTSKQLIDSWMANGIYIIRLSNDNTSAVLKWLKQ